MEIGRNKVPDGFKGLREKRKWRSCLGRNVVTEKRAERWVVAGGEYGVKEEFLLFVFAMMKLC